jgi:hypothetical protein
MKLWSWRSPRGGWSLSTVAMVLLLPFAGCSPELQPAFLCAPDVSVPFAEAPAGLVTAQTQKIVEFYLSLGGAWDAYLECPEGAPNSGSVTVSIQPDPTEAMRVIVGADLTRPGYDCHAEGTVLAGGQITLAGASIGGLSGAHASLAAGFRGQGKIEFSFDPSYDPGLAAVDGLIEISGDLSLFNVISFAQLPTQNSDGSYAQIGYNCGLTLLARK